MSELAQNRRMVGSGELPAGTRCAVSGVPTEDVIELYVEAERVFVGGDNLRFIALFAMLCSPYIAVFMAQRSRPDFGRATTVATPLRVAALKSSPLFKVQPARTQALAPDRTSLRPVVEGIPESANRLRGPGRVGPFQHNRRSEAE
jgi:hypothetical protein